MTRSPRILLDSAIVYCKQSNGEDFLLALEWLKELNDPSSICEFAEYANGADEPQNMKELEDAIIETGDINQIYEFLYCMTDCGMTNFNQKRFEELVCNSGNSKLIFYMMECVPNIDMNKAIDAFLSLNNPKWAVKFLENNELKSLVSPTMLKQFEEKQNEINDIFIPKSLEKYSSDKVQSPAFGILQNIIMYSPTPYNANEYDEYISPQFKSPRPVRFSFMLEKACPLDLYEYLCSVEILTDEQKEAIVNRIISLSDIYNAKVLYYLLAYADVNDKMKHQIKNTLKFTGNQKYIAKLRELDIMAAEND